jgi:hypothetical protein
VEERPVVRNVEAVNCASPRAQASFKGVIFEDVVLEGFTGGGSAVNCAFRRVTLVGLFPNDFWIEADTEGDDSGYWSPFVAANETLHRDAEYTLDVSRASFANAAIRGLPPASIRIDPTTQAVITDESMVGAAEMFTDDELVGKVGLRIRLAIEGRFMDHLVTVSSGSRNPERERSLIRKLHENGLALPA